MGCVWDEMAGTSENGDKKREDAKGLKLVASDKNLPGDSRHSGSSNSDSSGTRGVPIGFSEAVIEQFVRDSLESAMNQFAAQGIHYSHLILEDFYRNDSCLIVQALSSPLCICSLLPKGKLFR